MSFLGYLWQRIMYYIMLVDHVALYMYYDYVKGTQGSILEGMQVYTRDMQVSMPEYIMQVYIGGYAKISKRVCKDSIQKSMQW